MSKFVMKTKPKKPIHSPPMCYEVGNYVTIGYLLECMEDFKAENPEVAAKEVVLEAEYDEYVGLRMFLTAPQKSQKNFEIEMETYKTELRAYKAWQVMWEKEIKDAKAITKKKIAKRKLSNTIDRLAKEMDEAVAKLDKV